MVVFDSKIEALAVLKWALVMYKMRERERGEKGEDEVRSKKGSLVF